MRRHTSGLGYPDYTIEQTLAEMKAMIEGAQRKRYAPPAGEGAPDDEKKMLLRDVVIDAIMTTGVRFWHDPDGVAYWHSPARATRGSATGFARVPST